MEQTPIQLPNFTHAGHNYGNCTLHIAKYTDQNRALLIETAQGAPLTTVTINLSHDGMLLSEPDAFFVKDYSENTGIAAELRNRGIIEPTGGMARLPYGEPVAEYRLTAAEY